MTTRFPRLASARRPGDRGRRDRRGAVVLLVGILLVMIMTMGAVTLEASRLYEIRTELQTASDAGALGGAIELLRRTDSAIDSAKATAARNYAAGAKVTDVTVTTGTWDDASRTFTPTLPLSADAVQVTARASYPVFFAGLLGGRNLTVSTSSIAWSSAPVVETSCIKPFAIPYQVVKDILRPSGSTLTEDDFRRLDDIYRNNQDATRFGLNFGQDWATDTTSTGARDRYYAADIPPTFQASSGTAKSVPLDPSGATYANNIRKCSSAPIGLGDSLRVDPGTRADSTVAAMPQFCASYSGNVCYGDLGFPGQMMKAVFYDNDPNWDGSGTLGTVGIKLIGSFVLDSVYASGPNKGRIAGRLRATRDYGKIGNSPTSLRRAVLVQ